MKPSNLIVAASLLLAMMALTGQPQAMGQIKPAPPPAASSTGPAVPAAPKATTATNIQLLFADCYTYKRMDSTKDKGFSTYLKAAPHEAQLPADEKVFTKAWLDQVKADVEVESNRGTKGIKVTKVKFLRFGLSQDNSRFSEVEVLFEGTKPKAGGMPTDTEPLVPSGSADSASVTLVLDKGTWNAKHSEDMAGQWRRELHIQYGRPDNGDTWVKVLPSIESKLKIRPVARKDDD